MADVTLADVLVGIFEDSGQDEFCHRLCRHELAKGLSKEAVLALLERDVISAIHPDVEADPEAKAAVQRWYRNRAPGWIARPLPEEQ